METKLTSGTTAELIQRENTDRGLVIIPDVMGLRPLFIDLANRLAEEWNTQVCTFEVFPEHDFSETDPNTNLQNRYAAVKELKDTRLFADVTEAAQLTQGARLGLMGFCMGGMYTLKSMSLGVFNRGAAFYPQIKLPENWRGPEQSEPLQSITSETASSILAIIGTIDDYTPPADVETLENVGVATIRYEDCDHGFVHDPARPTHKPEEAADALGKAYEFLFPA